MKTHNELPTIKLITDENTAMREMVKISTRHVSWSRRY